jgi:hypothetical protein
MDRSVTAHTNVLGAVREGYQNSTWLTPLMLIATSRRDDRSETVISSFDCESALVADRRFLRQPP